MFKPNLRRYAKKALEERGVEVLLGDVVASITPTRVTLKSGSVLEAHTLVWGAGLQASPISRSLGVELQKGSRIGVEPSLGLAGHPEVFAVGDIAWITDTKAKHPLPQLGSVALQSGEHAGETIARLVAGKKVEPFAYHDKGTMATIGRGAAVIQFAGGRTMKGKMACAGLGVRPSRAPVHRRGSRQGDAGLDVGGLHARTRGPDHGAHRRGVTRGLRRPIRTMTARRRLAYCRRRNRV